LGDFEKIPVPPFLRGARGDLSLIVKQQSLTEFNVKLTLRRARLSVPTGVYLINVESAVSKNIPNFRPTYTVCSQLQKT